MIVARRRLLEWHEQFSRFNADSELARLNGDPAETVPVSPLMRRVVEAGDPGGGGDTGGLVDPTLLDQIERAGYDAHFDQPGPPAARRARASAGAPSRPTVAGGELAARADRSPDELGDPAAGSPDRPGRNRQGRVRRRARRPLCRTTRRSSSNAPAIYGWAEGSRPCARCTWPARSTTRSSTRSGCAPAASPPAASASAAGSAPTERSPTTCSTPAPDGRRSPASSRSRRSRRPRWRRRRSARPRSCAVPVEAERVLVHGGVIVLDDGDYVVLDPGEARC